MVLQASSGGSAAGDFAKISINDAKVHVHKNSDHQYRGIHIVLINPQTGKVIFGKVFDTYKSSDTFHDFMQKPIAPGTIVVAAVRYCGVTGLSYPAKVWFGDLGSRYIWFLGFRESFAMIAVSGRSEGNFDIIEKRGFESKAESVSVTKVFINESGK